MQGYQQLNCQDLSPFLAAGGALVDIRRPEEWRLTGVVPQSHLLTFFEADGSNDPTLWLDRLDALVPTEQPLALICRSGYRTELLCDFLSQVSKRQQIYNVSGGILDWLAAGQAVEDYAG